MNGPEMFRVRFRFRLQKKLHINAKSHWLRVGPYDVELTPQLPDVEIAESEWLVLNAKAIQSEAEARVFAQKIKRACELSSVGSRLGIDSGVDLPTSGLGTMVKDHLRQEFGILVRDNVHGIDVFVDDPNVRYFHINGTASVSASPDPFLTDIGSYFEVLDDAFSEINDIVVLLNYALMRPEPIAQIVFAFSAVEMLGQKEEWTPAQKVLLDKLAELAKNELVGSELERQEIAEAIKRSHKLSLRQGVLRLLAKLGLNHLKPIWDNLYAERSTLVHGLAPKAGADYSSLATRTVNLCGHILLKVISTKVAGADRHASRLYDITYKADV